MKKWFEIDNIHLLDSPSLAIYEHRMVSNIDLMISMVSGETSRLMPHVKTHKMPQVVDRFISKGVVQFKASTIAEAEMAAAAGAHYILIAHQLVGPKTERLMELIKAFPSTRFSTLVDNQRSAFLLNNLAAKHKLFIDVNIDVNTGMDRTGIAPCLDMEKLIHDIAEMENLNFIGFHVYDGHLLDPDFNERNQSINDQMEKVMSLFEMYKNIYPDIKLVTGGSPSFTSHRVHSFKTCSPGTQVFWDWSYMDMLPEQNFNPAAILITRIISKPADGLITIDLGHKGVASENPIDKRIKFLNLEDYTLISQSEEHGVVRTSEWKRLHVGQVLYGIPFHICPTVNLYEQVYVVDGHHMYTVWDVTARKRRITI